MDAVETALGVFRILETGDPELAVAMIGDDFRNREAAVAPAACSFPGPAGVLASGAWLRSAFSDLRFPVLGTAAGGDQVWVRLRMRGRHTGPFVRYRDGRLDQIVPPTGREIDFEQIHVLDIRAGQVVRPEAVRDDVTMLGQLGVFPPAPAVGLRLVGWRLSGRAAREAAAVAARAEEAAAALTGRSEAPRR
jgi:predicted ester cyclase